MVKNSNRPSNSAFLLLPTPRHDSVSNSAHVSFNPELLLAQLAVHIIEYKYFPFIPAPRASPLPHPRPRRPRRLSPCFPRNLVVLLPAKIAPGALAHDPSGHYTKPFPGRQPSMYQSLPAASNSLRRCRA